MLKMLSMVTSDVTGNKCINKAVLTNVFGIILQ